MRAIGVALSALVLTSCALLLDFDDYERARARGDGGPPTGAAGAPFGLAVPSELLLDPGATTEVPVQVTRQEGDSSTILISLSTPLPNGVDLPSTAAIAGDRGEGSLLVTTRAAAVPLETGTIEVVATNGGATKRATIRVSFRGARCGPDRTFGRDGIADIVSFGGVNQILFVRHDADAILVAVAANSEISVGQYDLTGIAKWERSAVAEGEAACVTTTKDGTVLLGLRTQGVSTFRRVHPDLSEDFEFGDAGAVEVPGPAHLIDNEGIVNVSPSSNVTFTATRYDALGHEIVSADARYENGYTVDVAAVATSGGNVVGCGTAVSTIERGTFVRWLRSGDVDTSFAVGGRKVLSVAPTRVSGCISDDAGVVGSGVYNRSLALFGLDPKGNVDSAFGDGGVVLLGERPADDVYESDILETDDGLIVMDRSAHDHSLALRRLKRNGEGDPAFAACTVDRAVRGTPARITSAPYRRLLIASPAGTDGLILERLWL